MHNACSGGQDGMLPPNVEKGYEFDFPSYIKLMVFLKFRAIWDFWDKRFSLWA